MSDPPGVEPGSESRVVGLRLASLERAGYDPGTAEALAGRLDVPLQDALALRRAGFPPDAAFAILTSRDRPVF